MVAPLPGKLLARVQSMTPAGVLSQPAITYAVRRGRKTSREKGCRLIETIFRRAMI
jgi:hypothetical protein